jgi:hypothetical protein
MEKCKETLKPFVTVRFEPYFVSIGAFCVT